MLPLRLPEAESLRSSKVRSYLQLPAYVLGDDVDWQTEIKTEEDLLPPGAAVGTVPTDLEQATGLERLEILGKMQGIDIFDMKPLDASRKGTCSRPRNQTTRNWAHLG